MKSLTLRLPEPLIASIETEARRRHTTKSDVVRRRLEQADAVPRATDTWAAVEGILEEGWKAKTPAAPMTWRNPQKQKILNAIHAKKHHRR